MSEIRADRRRRQVECDPAEVTALDELAATYLEQKRALAKRLAQFEARGGHLALGFGAARDYARDRLGIPGAEIGALLDLGRVLDHDAEHVASAWGGDPGEGDRTSGSDSGDDADVTRPSSSALQVTSPPSVEDRVAQRAMSTENAATLGRLFREVRGLTPVERADWTLRAETQSGWKFRQLVRKLIEETAQREVTVPLALQVTERARDDFRHARELASRRAGRWLTEGQTFALVVRRFVRDEDERLVVGKRRRVGDTSSRPESRYVPASVKRAVRTRAEDRCEVPGCSNGSFVEFMHLEVAHRDGGSREIDNLALGCTAHHLLLDAGVIRFGGWQDGRPVFLGRRGSEIDERVVSSRAHAVADHDESCGAPAACAEVSAAVSPSLPIARDGCSAGQPSLDDTPAALAHRLDSPREARVGLTPPVRERSAGPHALERRTWPSSTGFPSREVPGRVSERSPMWQSRRAMAHHTCGGARRSHPPTRCGVPRCPTRRGAAPHH